MKPAHASIVPRGFERCFEAVSSRLLTAPRQVGGLPNRRSARLLIAHSRAAGRASPPSRGGLRVEAATRTSARPARCPQPAAARAGMHRGRASDGAGRQRVTGGAGGADGGVDARDVLVGDGQRDAEAEGERRRPGRGRTRAGGQPEGRQRSAEPRAAVGPEDQGRPRAHVDDRCCHCAPQDDGAARHRAGRQRAGRTARRRRARAALRASCPRGQAASAGDADRAPVVDDERRLSRCTSARAAACERGQREGTRPRGRRPRALAHDRRLAAAAPRSRAPAAMQ